MRIRLRGFVGLIAILSTFTLSGQIDAQRALQIGRNAIATRDYAIAIEHLNQAIEVRSDWAEPFYWRGLAKLMLSDYMGTIQDATSAIERNPAISRAFFIRGIAYQSLSKLKNAAEDYRKVIGLTPDDPDPRFNLSGTLFTAEKYDEAEKEVELLIKKHPDYLKAYKLSVEIQLHKKDTLKAESTIRQILEKDSLQAFPYRILGLIAYQRNQFDKAIEYNTAAIRISPNELSDYINRGLARFKKYDLKGAIEDYNYAVTLAPYDITARYNRALLQMFVSDPNGALEDFKIIAQKDPQNMVVRYNLALLRYELGLLDEAIQDFDILLKRHPAFIDGYYYRSEIKKKKGDIRGADKDYWYAYGLEHKQIKMPQDPDAEELQNLSDHKSLLENSLQAFQDIEESNQGNVSSASSQGNIHTAWKMYQLSYFETESFPFALRSNYNSELESYNLRNSEKSRFLLTQSYAPIDSTSIRMVVEDLEQSLQNSAQDAKVAFRIATNYFILKDYERAIDYASRAIDQDPQFPFLYWVRAMAQYHRLTMQNVKTPIQDNPMASLILEDLSTIIKLSPKMGYAYYNRAYILALMGKREKAMADYTEAIKLLPNPATAYYNRALLQLEEKHLEEAQKDLSLAGEKGMRSAYTLIKEIQEKL